MQFNATYLYIIQPTMRITNITITTPTIAPANAPIGTLLPPLEVSASPVAEVNVSKYIYIMCVCVCVCVHVCILFIAVTM